MRLRSDYIYFHIAYNLWSGQLAKIDIFLTVDWQDKLYFYIKYQASGIRHVFNETPLQRTIVTNCIHT